MAIPAGTPVPAFRLAREDLSPFTEADLRGRTSVLVFYPFAFSEFCTDQLGVYDAVLDDLEARGATMYAVSCDNVHAQRAFREQLGIRIEMLSDWEPKGETCRAFDVLHPAGFPQRALVLVGPDGVVRWSHQAPTPNEVPGANLIFDALEAAAA